MKQGSTVSAEQISSLPVAIAQLRVVSFVLCKNERMSTRRRESHHGRSMQHYKLILCALRKHIALRLNSKLFPRYAIPSLRNPILLHLLPFLSLTETTMYKRCPYLDCISLYALRKHIALRLNSKLFLRYAIPSLIYPILLHFFSSLSHRKSTGYKCYHYFDYLHSKCHLLRQTLHRRCELRRRIRSLRALC